MSSETLVVRDIAEYDIPLRVSHQEYRRKAKRMRDEVDMLRVRRNQMLGQLQAKKRVNMMVELMIPH